MHMKWIDQGPKNVQSEITDFILDSQKNLFKSYIMQITL